MLTVVLAVVGASAGWAVAGSESDSNADPGPTPTAMSSQPRSSDEDEQEKPTESPTPSPSARSSEPPSSLPMPDVLGMECEEAVEKLREAGLKPQDLLLNRGKVIRQSPEAGEQVERGQVVLITCVRGNPPGGPSPSASDDDGGDDG
ncbi:PASTA domain-containing protein [Polymorphospora rubra]|uniref:PASTA domain-containing protein n=1 Tax=Polymorphospora rubra TaxID=338584 RepID=UPI0033E1B10B